MEVKVTTWKVSTLLSKLDKINDQPEYQRGKVWSKSKNALLIDSILRGIDIPKIYLRQLSNSTFDYEVADGQQRINALRNFNLNRFELLKGDNKGLDLTKVGRYNIGGLTYDELPNELQEIVDSFDLTIAIIKNASGEEIRTLFSRLQEGETLNPAEKRNAIISPIRNHVDSIARNHNFFENSRISERRFKWQDFVAHVLTLVAYENKEDLKAGLIMKLYLDKSFKVMQKLLGDFSNILDTMIKIDEHSKKRIYKKHHFIDVFWFLYRHLERLKNIDHVGFASEFDNLEVKRLNHNDEPSRILEKDEPEAEKKAFYDYVMSFKFSGTLAENIDKRAKYMDMIFKKFLK